jgi:endoglucanase Acf2
MKRSDYLHSVTGINWRKAKFHRATWYSANIEDVEMRLEIKITDIGSVARRVVVENDMEALYDQDALNFEWGEILKVLQ